MQESPVKIFSEFQKLEEIIVGSAHPKDAFYFSNDPELKGGLETILGETEEDLGELVKLLEGMDVTVKRPKHLFELGKENRVNTIDLGVFDFTFPNHPLMPRDTVLILNNKIIQTYTKSENRFFENWHYYDLFLDYFERGADWISMPEPYIENNPPTYSELENQKILFHAANVIKCGRDLFFSQPSFGEYSKKGKGTEIGLEWIKRVVGPEYRLNPAPCAGHIDGKIALIKPGVLIAWDQSHIPDKLKPWHQIFVDTGSPFPEHFNKIKKKRFYKDFVQEWLSEWIGYVDETVFDVNMLSVSEKVVITNGYNKKVFDELKKHGVEAVPWNFRHQYFWDGAIHCVTLDVRRKGECEDYFA